MICGHWLVHSRAPLAALLGFLVCGPALGAQVQATCDLVRKVSRFQISAMTHLAGDQISAREKNYLQAHYSGLKAECGANPRASRVVAVSPELQSLLQQHGVRIKNKRLIVAKRRKHNRKLA